MGMTNGKTISGTTARELALAGISDQTRALALEVALKTGVPDDDALWLLFIAASAPSAVTQTLMKKLGELEKNYSTIQSINKDVSALSKAEDVMLKRAEQIIADLQGLANTSNKLVLQQWLWLSVLAGSILVCSAGWLFIGYFHAQKQLDIAFGGNAQRNYAQLLWTLNRSQIQQCQEKQFATCEINLKVPDDEASAEP